MVSFSLSVCQTKTRAHVRVDAVWWRYNTIQRLDRPLYGRRQPMASFFILALLFFVPTRGWAFGATRPYAILCFYLNFFPFLLIGGADRIHYANARPTQKAVGVALFPPFSRLPLLFALGGCLRLAVRAHRCGHAQDKARPRATTTQKKRYTRKKEKKKKKTGTDLPAAPCPFFLLRRYTAQYHHTRTQSGDAKKETRRIK